MSLDERLDARVAPSAQSLDLALDDDDDDDDDEPRVNAGVGGGACDATPTAGARGRRTSLACKARQSLAGVAGAFFAPPKKVVRVNSSSRLLGEPLLDDEQNEGTNAEAVTEVELGGASIQGAGATSSAPPALSPPSDDDVIDLLRDASGELRAGVDLAPLTVFKHTRLARMSFMLRTLGASTVNVIDEGRLAGVLTRVSLFKVERDLFARMESAKGEGDIDVEPPTPDGPRS